MVHDDVLVVHSREGVTLLFLDGAVATTETHIAHDDLVGTNTEWEVGNADAIARSGLTGNGATVVVHIELRLQIDGSTHIEDDDTCPLTGAGITEGTLLFIILQGSHMIYLTPTSTVSITSKTFCAGESRHYTICRTSIATECPKKATNWRLGID